MSAFRESDYTVSADRIGQLSDIQHRAMVLLGRLRSSKMEVLKQKMTSQRTPLRRSHNVSALAYREKQPSR